MSSAALLQALRETLGDAHVLTADPATSTNLSADSGDLTAYTQDWRGRYRGKALAVLRPASVEEIAAIVALCAAHGASLVPQGGNTSLVGGSVPDDSGTQVVLSLQRMNQVVVVDAANATLTAQAGCTLLAAQQAAAAHGLLLPLSLAAEGTATLGGVLSTNAGGTQVLRYGTARDLCLGLEVVTAQGEVWSGLSGLRKDNTGYALRDLFIGSEGTLGIITAATLRLFAQPAAQLTALASVGSLDDALTLLQAAQRQLGSTLTAFEVINDHAQAVLANHFPELASFLPRAPWWVLMEQSDAESEAHARALFEALMTQALGEAVVLDAVVAQSLAQSAALWRMRESIPLAQARTGLNIKHDISLPLSRIPEFVTSTDAEINRRWPGSHIINFGHLGDGNLHYNLQAPEGVEAPVFLAQHEAAVNALVFDAVQAHGGSISAEHGIGVLKREELQRRKSPVALGLMRAIKHALDPHNRLNPGKVLATDLASAQQPSASFE
jgi:FAD/FMN-containing dehydrogenase